MKDKDALSADAPDTPPAAGRPSVGSFLLAHALDGKRESVRILAGFAVLVVAGVALLNAMLWHNAGKRIEAEAWRRLEVATDVRSADIEHLLDVFRREALSVARDPYINSAVRSLRPGTVVSESSQLLDELFARSAEFEFRN